MSSREYLGNRYFFKPNTFARTRYKSRSWRLSAWGHLRKMSRRHGGQFIKTALANYRKKGDGYVGWTAKTAPIGTKAFLHQKKWRRAYFKKHGTVV